MLRLTTCSLCIALSSWSLDACADWPQFLGPHRNGTVTEAPQLLDSFPASGPKVLWRVPGGQSSLRSEWQTPLRIGDYVYGFDNVGSAGAVTHLSCIDAQTGENQWKKTRFGKANAILVDGRMIAANMKGELILGRLAPTGYNEADRAKVIDSTRQAPAFVDGKVFLRDDREFVCIDLRNNQ